MNAPQTATLAQLRSPAPEVPQPYEIGLTNSQGFELAQRAAKLLAASTLVPKEYQGNLPNCVIALNMAARVGADPLMVMQNLIVIHGRPTWSAQFLIATVNTCGRFTALRYEFFGTTNADDWGCRAWAIEKATGEKLVGTDVTIAIAKKEGWYAKSGSKWQSIPQQMLMYRAGSWWTRAYAPELSMGLHTADEMADVYDTEFAADGSFQVTAESLRNATPVHESATVIDAGTGEIVESNTSRASAESGTAHVQQGGAGAAASNPSGGPTFEDAVAAVNAGKFDEASDIARSLSDGQRQQIEHAIANKKAPPEQATASRRKATGGASVE